MTQEPERRRHERKPCEPPRVAAVRPLGGGEPSLFVSVPDLSPGGVRLLSHAPLETDGGLELALLDQEQGLWELGRGRVAWSRGMNGGKTVQVGLALAEPLRPVNKPGFPLPRAAELAFVLGTKMLRFLPTEAVCPLLNCLKPLRLEAGQRFITQGDEGESLFIIQEGLCSVKMTDEDEPRTVAQLRGGEVVGEMALLTGGERTASVDADTDMRIWELHRADFDRVAAEHPDLREFLTELLTERLDKSPVMAVRNVGRYTMISRLGRGGFSLVYRGRHRNLNMTVAIKMLKHNLAMDEDFLERFRDEARIIAGLNHPNIVKVFDIIERYRTIFIMMEYLEGEPLSAIMERGGALPLHRALNFLRQICRGLEYAHNQGIVHLDVKPANIYVLPGDQIRILDFGLASTQGEDDTWMAGTPRYMAPEQIEGDPVDGRTDVYALGLTAYEMLLGSEPFANRDVAELLRLHLTEEVPDPALIAPDLPPAMRDFIVRASRRDPAARFQSMAQAEAALPSPEASTAASSSSEAGRKVTVLLISHDEEQKLALNQLLDEFSVRAEALGLKVNIAGQGEV